MIFFSTRTKMIFQKSKQPNHHMGVSKIGVPQNVWFIMENPIKMDDLGVPLFSETAIFLWIKQKQNYQTEILNSFWEEFFLVPRSSIHVPLDTLDTNGWDNLFLTKLQVPPSKGANCTRSLWSVSLNYSAVKLTARQWRFPPFSNRKYIYKLGTDQL